MRVAPDDPEKAGGFKSRFLRQVLRQAGGPFTSSVVQLSQKPRKVVVLNSQRELAISPSVPSPYRVWLTAMAHAMRANLLASAQATTFE